MFGHPPFVARYVRRDTQGEALLAKQGIAPVTGTERPDLTSLWKMDDVFFLVARLGDVGLPRR
jgi:hypothetical protein